MTKSLLLTLNRFHTLMSGVFFVDFEWVRLKRWIHQSILYEIVIQVFLCCSPKWKNRYRYLVSFPTFLECAIYTEDHSKKQVTGDMEGGERFWKNYKRRNKPYVSGTLFILFTLLTVRIKFKLYNQFCTENLLSITVYFYL